MFNGRHFERMLVTLTLIEFPHSVHSIEDMQKLLHTFKYNLEVYLLGRRVPRVVEYAGEGAAVKPRVHELRAVSVCGESGFVFDAGGNLFDVSAPVLAKSKIRRPVRLAAERVRGKVFHLAGECSWNRAHFMLEHGVRLMLAVQEGTLGSCEKLLVHGKPANWLDDYLEFFPGVGSGWEKVSTTKQTLVIDELVFVPGPSGDLLRFEDDVYRRYGEYLRSGVEKNLPPTSRGDLKKSGFFEKGEHAVWISRADAPERSCVNVAELQQAFTEATGREVCEVVLTGMPLVDQIRTLGEASVIVAEEGQALNLLPFVSGKQVIILDKGAASDQSRWNAGFERMGNCVGNEVHCLFSELDSTVLRWEYPVSKFREELLRLK